MRQNKLHDFTWADQDWIGLIIFKNYANQDWIGFNFIVSELDLDRKISQSTHLCRWLHITVVLDHQCCHFSLFKTKIWFILQSFGLFFCDLVYSLFF